MNQENVLSKFGRLLIKEVRDRTIHKFDLILRGEMHSAQSLALSEELGQLTADEQELMRRVVMHFVDTALHKLMFFFETSDDFKIADTAGNDLKKLSDGLAGELCT